MENTIEISSEGKLKANIFCIAGKEGDFFIAIAPSLKLSANSKESQEQAKVNLKEALDWFFKYYNTEESLDKELKRLGWKDHSEPDFSNVPMSLLENKPEMYREEVYA